jgi:hypothetical protein
MVQSLTNALLDWWQSESISYSWHSTNPFVHGCWRLEGSLIWVARCSMLVTSRLSPPLVSRCRSILVNVSLCIMCVHELVSATSLSNTSVNLQFDKLDRPVAHAWECAIKYFALMSIEPCRVTDVCTAIYIYTYIHIQFAHSHTVYVGLAQARPNYYTIYLLKIRPGNINIVRASPNFWRLIFNIPSTCAFYSHL